MFVQRKRPFVSLCLHGVGTANLEGGVANNAGTTVHGEGNGNGVEQLAATISDINRFVLDDIEADE